MSSFFPEVLRPLASLRAIDLGRNRFESMPLTELSDVCTSYGVIEKGRILSWGRMDGLAAQSLEEETEPRLRFHLGFASPCAESVLEVLRKRPEIESSEAEGAEAHLTFRGRPDAFHVVIRALVERELPLVTIEREGENLERVFLEVTRGDLQ